MLQRNARADGGNLGLDRAWRSGLLSDHLSQRNDRGDVRIRDGRGARTAVRLNDVAIDSQRFNTKPVLMFVLIP